MKKYQLGTLTVSDKGLQDTKEEVIIELIDAMQKRFVAGDQAYKDPSASAEEKLRRVERNCNYFCALADFLQATMGVDVRDNDGMLYPQKMFNKFHFWRQTLEIEVQRKREAEEDG